MDETEQMTNIELTLDEKASLCVGQGCWHTREIKEKGIKTLLMSDGPSGIRRGYDVGETPEQEYPTVGFPTGSAVAATFHRELIHQMGKTLGNECRTQGINILLGPSMNIKRTPVCGRNFEYYSEDPYLTGEMAASYITGVQSCGVAAVPKHFFGNNTETCRQTVSAEMDERTMHEIYLAAFEKAVKQAKPKALMCSYNRVNGIHATDNAEILQGLLRDRWGYDGICMSDWGASNDIVSNVAAGLNLEMPENPFSRAKLVQAVKQGKLDEKLLDERSHQMVEFIKSCENDPDEKHSYDPQEDRKLSKQICLESIVLLKNERKVLPLKQGEKVLVLGKFARVPRTQGGGSSHVKYTGYVSFIEAVAEQEGITYADGFFEDDEADTIEKIKEKAEQVSAGYQKILVFAGLPDSFETEGYDRMHMGLPKDQNAVIERLCDLNKDVIVVLHNGSPVEMPWADRVSSILECYLGGETVGEAQADIIYGKVNPSGRLAETFPLRFEDTPAYLFDQIEDGKIRYQEGIYVGYRYYDSAKKDVLFPFGHGLSYTTFQYSDITVDKAPIKDTDDVMVTVQITNTGDIAGQEVVQLYIAAPKGEYRRPGKELKGFEKIELKPGEVKKVCFHLTKESYAYWDERLHDWHVPSGSYTVMIGRSVADIKLQTMIEIQSTQRIPFQCTTETVLGRILSDSDKKKELDFIMPIVGQMLGGGNADNPGFMNEKAVEAMLKDMPLRTLMGFGLLTEKSLMELITRLNKEENE